ncbi:MAG: DNA repair protein RadC [Bacilli bacterium]|nr:DNA repair protein RadC [Bacilli bacterium]
MNYLIKDIRKNDRPRERLLKQGSASLSDEELISIILKTGTKSRSVKILAIDVLNLVDDIQALSEISINKLLSIKGIGMVKAIELIASIELGRRIYREKNNKKVDCSTAVDVYENNRSLFIDKKQEYFYCLYLNNKNELIERKLLFMGTVNRSVVHPREVFKHAYLTSASGIICMHNHPSGDVSPSKDDIMFTKALVEVGRLQNIPILDHIIIGDNNYYSFCEKGII